MTGSKKNLNSLSLDKKRQLIEVSDKTLSVRKQCELIELPRASYYYKPAGVGESELEILRRIDEIYTEHPYYGTRRMSKRLQGFGIHVNRKRVRRYYALLGLCAVYPKMNLSKRNQAHKVYPYLLRGVRADHTNQVWSADITYIRLSHGFVYLVAVIDWYSRYVLSWRISTTLDNDFCVEALKEALRDYGRPEIFNTDQGVQFTSMDFINELKSHEIQVSMDGRGRALDNVFIERFWRSLKQEKIYRIELTTVRGAKNATNEYMKFYNTQRMHQSLEYQTPASVYFNERPDQPVDMCTSPTDQSAPFGTCGQGLDNACFRSRYPPLDHTH